MNNEKMVKVIKYFAITWLVAIGSIILISIAAVSIYRFVFVFVGIITCCATLALFFIDEIREWLK